MGKTKYFYKGKEISHLDLLQVMCQNGLISGYSVSHWEHLVKMAEKGDEKAVALLADLERIIVPAKDFEPFIGGWH